MRCAIVQPSYIPWRGYFDLIRRADTFVFYDDVQYDKRGWRNRNRIKSSHGTRWLTIPVKSRGAQIDRIPINQIATADDDWPRQHLLTLTHSYARAPFFKRYLPWLKRMYTAPPLLLADFTITTTIEIAQILGFSRTKFLRSSKLCVEGSKTDRLIAILMLLGATHYLSGPTAKDYLEEEKFAASGIVLEYIEYEYPEYPQLYPPFDPRLTVLDLLFMTGADAPAYI